MQLMIETIKGASKNYIKFVNTSLGSKKNNTRRVKIQKSSCNPNLNNLGSKPIRIVGFLLTI